MLRHCTRSGCRRIRRLHYAIPAAVGASTQPAAPNACPSRDGVFCLVVLFRLVGVLTLILSLFLLRADFCFSLLGEYYLINTLSDAFIWKELLELPVLQMQNTMIGSYENARFPERMLFVLLCVCVCVASSKLRSARGAGRYHACGVSP